MAADKYDNASDKRVFCPFYKGTIKKQKIVCEGPIKRTNVWITFSSKKRLEEYMEQYCYQQECWKCRVYECADKKYGEEES